MLFIVATPIGNLKDITYRAVETLKNVDYILCEDTRTSSVLLEHYEIKKPLHSYHKFNEKAMIDKIITDLQMGMDIALISDAGMPSISDPGSILVNEVIKNQIDYTVLPGAVAFINAYVLSGFTYPFSFLGFLPNKTSERKDLLKEIKDLKQTLIFYISPHSLNKDISDIYQVLGERKIAVARELTKKFEEFEFSLLSKGFLGTQKGEFVLLIEGASSDNNPLNALSVEEHLEFYLNLGYKKNDAIEMVSKERNMKKNEVYKFTFSDR